MIVKGTPATFAHSFRWQEYSVSSRWKRPLLDFVLDGLRDAGCKVLSASGASTSPFYIVFEAPNGERQSILAYAFHANSKVTKGRPVDEHRFQIKYGSDLQGTLDLATDQTGQTVTLLLGIDPELQIFVAADPLMNNPSPMSRSIEFKAEEVENIRRFGWAAWERDRRPGKSKHRETAEIDFRTEVLVGGTRDRILTLIALERLAAGLDPGERHLVADKLSADRKKEAEHPVLADLGLNSEALLDLIGSASRLKMAVRGWVAETHLVEQLASLPGVTECVRLEGDGRPDVSLRWRGGAPILIECKNTLRTTYKDGRPRVDFQRTRASKGDPCSRYYASTDFTVLAACLHSVTAAWEYRFALTAALPDHPKCVGKITSAIAVAEPLFTDRAEDVFYKCSQ